MSQDTELITIPKFAEMLDSFFKLVFLVKKKTKKVRERERNYDDFERNKGRGKNATDKKQKRIIHVNEHAWNLLTPCPCNGGDNYKAI